MCMTELEPHRIMIFQEDLLFLRLTTCFARNLTKRMFTMLTSITTILAKAEHKTKRMYLVHIFISIHVQ